MLLELRYCSITLNMSMKYIEYMKGPVRMAMVP